MGDAGAAANEGEAWRGKVGPLSAAEIEEFLAGPHIARVACMDDEGWPYVVPCWQEWDGAGWWVIPRERSAWAAYLDRDPRCAVTVDEDGGGQRKVIAQCTAEIVERPNVGGGWVPIATRMAMRYLGENGPLYLEPTLDKPRWLLRLQPRQLITWQGQDWAKRYK
jgi:hypothetical protein